jgi:hypothetical protein
VNRAPSPYDAGVATITLSFDPSRPEELEAARRVVETLLLDSRDSFPDDLTRELQLPLPSLDDQIMMELWPRLDGELRQLLKAAAELSCSQEDYSLGDLAEATGEEPEELRRQRSKLGQTLRVVEQRIPGAGPIIDQRFDASGDRWRYWLRPGVRDAILGRDVDETYS